MKTLLKKIGSLNIYFLCIFFALVTAFSSCTKEAIPDTILTEEIVSENIETGIDIRDPNIVVDDIAPSYCCGKNWQNKRRVAITLDALTYSHYCSGGNNLIYKFYNTNSPCSAPIVRASSLSTSTFCLPGSRDYTLFICASPAGCNLECNDGNDLSIPIGVPSSSPLYEFSLSSCRLILSK